MVPDYIPEERMHEYPQLAQRGATIPDYAPDIAKEFTEFCEAFVQKECFQPPDIEPTLMEKYEALAERVRAEGVEPQTAVVPVEEVGDAPRRGRPRKVITDGSDTG